MSTSRAEEIISILWLIASLIAFETNHNAIGWIAAVFALIATFGSIYYAIKGK